MKISYKWLKELVDLKDISFEELINDLSLHIIEVDEVTKLAYGNNLIIGEVVDCINHPNSDHLHICQVNKGDEITQIVCGAPNVAKGQKIILALPGAKLLGGEIKKSVIRGVESNGMICSLQELGVDHKYIPKEFLDGIYVLDEKAPIGSNALEYLGLDDSLIDLGLTPNRMDLLSMYGVARDVKAFYKRDLKKEEFHLTEDEKPTSSEVTVEIESNDCLSYNARIIKGVTIKESPTFIKSRLMASGIRPINNVVDITNYILMLFGQPLHSFDQDKLGNKIVVRNAYHNEEVTTLDDVKRVLNEDDIVITDSQNVTCVAGVMGCSNTEVDDNTKNIVLEAAIFNPLKVRQTSAKLALRSDSSTRFERGVDLNQTKEALDYATYLIAKYSGGKVLKGIVSKGVDHIDDTIIHLNCSDVKDYLGIELSKEQIIDILENLDFQVTSLPNNELQVNVPNRRMDIKIKADLIEEIARLVGYDKLELTLPKMSLMGELTTAQKRINIIRHTLSHLGLNEIITYALVSTEANQTFNILNDENKQNIELLHPMSEEHKVLRKSIMPSMLSVVKYNASRKNSDLALFEIGSTYYQNAESIQDKTLGIVMCGKFNGNNWNGGKYNVDYYHLKGIVENLAQKLGILISFVPLNTQSNEMHPGRTALIKFQNEIIGYLGCLHPALVKELEIPEAYVLELKLDRILNQKNSIEKFSPIIKKPTVIRDLALVMDKKIIIQDIYDTITKTLKKVLAKVEIFDLFESPLLINKKSVAFKLYFESEDDLTDDIINQYIQQLLDTLNAKFGIELRK